MLGCTVRLLLFAGMLPRFVRDATLSLSLPLNASRWLTRLGLPAERNTWPNPPSPPTLGCVPLLICAPRIPFPDKANRIERHARLDTPPPPPLRGILQLCEFLRRFAYESSAFRFAWLDVHWRYYTARIGVRTIGIFRSTSLGLLEESWRGIFEGGIVFIENLNGMIFPFF